MKFTAVLLLFCMTFASFSGVLKADKNCRKDTCHEKKAKNDDDCSGRGCSPLLNCSICGFITEQPLAISPGYEHLQVKPVTFYNTGKLSAYHKADWKPPKAC